MRKLIGSLTVCLALACATVSCAQTSSSGIAPANSAWGAFKPGAWSRVRIVIETLAPDGTVADMSTTVQTTTLVNVGLESVELKVDATVDVGGKQFEAPSQTVRQLFGGQTITATAQVATKSLGDGNVTIEDRTIACQVEQSEVTEKASKTLAKTFYSAPIFPHVLRVETTTTTNDQDETTSQSLGEIIALDMPYRTATGATRNVAVWQEGIRKSKGAVERSIALRGDEIPGGVVARWSKELDDEGRLVRRSMLELIDFGTEKAAP